MGPTVNHSHACSNVSSLEIEFDGVIPSHIRSEIVKEFIKYILYERSQIPMCFDQIKEFFNKEQKNSKPDVSIKRFSSISDQQSFLQNMNILFDTISDIFENITPIKQILILLGSNILNPKDSYIINFPTEFLDGDLVSRQVCINKVFQSLISADFLGTVKPLNSCTSLFVMFLAPRDSNCPKIRLLPKLSFNLPLRGTRYSINFLCKNVELGSAEISNEVINVSGIEELNLSTDDTFAFSLHHRPTTNRIETSPVVAENNDDLSNHGDYIWYQVPTVVKGYKESVANGANVWDIK